jgi:hypothetical protein
MDVIIVNNRGKFGRLFPFNLSGSPWQTRGYVTPDNALRTTTRLLTAMERSVATLIGALPVADIAFVILVVAYVKAS